MISSLLILNLTFEAKSYYCESTFIRGFQYSWITDKSLVHGVRDFPQ